MVIVIVQLLLPTAETADQWSNNELLYFRTNTVTLEIIVTVILIVAVIDTVAVTVSDGKPQQIAFSIDYYNHDKSRHCNCAVGSCSSLQTKSLCVVGNCADCATT